MFKINPIYHDIQLSFGTSDVKRTVIKQNSENTHILQIKLYDKQNNEMTIDNNWNLHISALKGDKTHIFNANNISVVDNTIQVMMTKQMLAASGTEKCELVIQDGENVLFSDTFLIYVEPNIQDGSFIESSNEYDSIVDILDHVQEQKDTVDQLTDDIQETYDELADAVEQTNELIAENEIIKANEQARIKAENTRITNEEKRITDTTTAVTNAETATKKANDAADDLQNKLDSHHFVLTEDKDMANGVPSLDSNTKIPNTELYEATTTSKGITQLTDSVSSDSTTTAATPNSVKTAYDKAMSIENDINTNRANWNDKYTKNQVDNKFSALETNIDWKESVETYNDITTAYPNPVDGWTVNVKDTDYTYRYNGTEWVVISANAIPKATNDVDGLLSKEDHVKYEDANSKKHEHDNKFALDEITNSSIESWNTAKVHADSTHAPSNAEVNQNAFSHIAVGSSTVSASSQTDTLTLEENNITITPDTTYHKVTIGITKNNIVSALGFMPAASTASTTSAGSPTQPIYISNGTPTACTYTLGKSVPSNAVFTDTNTTYSAGTGISLSGTTFSNSGVRSISSGSTNGTISVNTNGTNSNVTVKGFGTVATNASDALQIATDNEEWISKKSSWTIVNSVTGAGSSSNGVNIQQILSQYPHATEFNIICTGVVSSGYQYVYNYTLSVAAYNNFVGSSGTTNIIQGYSTGSYHGLCELCVVKPYLYIKSLTVGNTSYTGSQVAMAVYVK